MVWCYTGMKILAALLTAVLLWLSPAPATAVVNDGDTRPCATTREVNLVQAAIGRTELEARWEVTGLGVPGSVLGIGDVVAYPWCDHLPFPHSFAAVQYGGANGRTVLGVGTFTE